MSERMDAATRRGKRMAQAAFPPQEGVSLRDYFAAAALTGFLADGSQRLVAKEVETDPKNWEVNDNMARRAIVNALIADACYEIAAAMLTESERRSKT